MSGIADDILDWVLEKILPWVLILLLAFVALAVLYGAYAAGDYLWTVSKEGHVTSGVVVEKHHSHATTTYVQAGKVMVPVFTSERWFILVYGGRERSHRNDTERYSVSEESYLHTQIGDKYP